MLRAQPRDMLEGLADRMLKGDQEQVDLLVKQTGLTEATVREKLMVNNVDITLTPKEALELNVATEVLK